MRQENRDAADEEREDAERRDPVGDAHDRRVARKLWRIESSALARLDL